MNNYVGRSYELGEAVLTGAVDERQVLGMVAEAIQYRTLDRSFWSIAYDEEQAPPVPALVNLQRSEGFIK